MYTSKELCIILIIKKNFKGYKMYKRSVVFVCILLVLIGCSRVEEVFEDISSVEDADLDNNREVSVLFTPSFEPSDLLQVQEMLLPKENSRMRTATISHVMLHFTSNVLNNHIEPYKIEDIYNIFEKYKVSAHYVIDREGAIFQFVGENRVAYHAGKGNNISEFLPVVSMNDKSIGIELLAIGTKEEMVPLITEETYNSLDPSLIGYTDEQYKSLNELLNDILTRHKTINRDREHIIGHDEYAPVRKPDPGKLFDWSKVRF